MHWTLAELRALTRNEYDALVEWLRERQTPAPAEDDQAEERIPWA